MYGENTLTYREKGRTKLGPNFKQQLSYTRALYYVQYLTNPSTPRFPLDSCRYKNSHFTLCSDVDIYVLDTWKTECILDPVKTLHSWEGLKGVANPDLDQCV